MKRRSFLQMLGIGAAASPMAALRAEPKPTPEPVEEPQQEDMSPHIAPLKAMEGFVRVDDDVRMVYVDIPHGYRWVDGRTIYTLIQEALDEPHMMDVEDFITAFTPSLFEVRGGWQIEPMSVICGCTEEYACTINCNDVPLAEVWRYLMFLDRVHQRRWKGEGHHRVSSLKRVQRKGIRTT